MDSPWLMNCPSGTLMITPPLALSGRQPAGVSDVPNAVTYCTRSFLTASPLRWQRSSIASLLTKGGRQRGTKLQSDERVHKQEKRVLTIQSSSPAKAIS